jgi:ribosomal protein L32
MQKSKESTLRIAIFNETKVLSTYTLESSFCGCDFGSNSGLHLTTEDLKLMGKQLCLAIMINNNLNPTNSLQKSIQKLEILEEIKENKDILTSSNDDCSSGSDSDPSEDNLDEPEYVKLMQNPLPKKRVSSDAGARKKNAFKKEKLGLQIHLKNSRQGEKPMKMIQKCFNCGEAKDVNHVCAKKITMNKTMVHNYTLQESKGGNIRVSLTKRNYNSLSKSSNVFPVYTRADGKKVRDQATQTTATITSRKPDSNRASLYFLSVNSSPVSANNSHKKSDVLENLVDLEKLRNIFRNDKNILPSLSPVKNTNEKFTKTL